MNRRSVPVFRQLGMILMLLAVAGFLLQNASSAVTQAAAAAGFMPEAAVHVSEHVHSHGRAATVFHNHDDDDEGHVHNSSDPRHHNLDGKGQIWTVGGVSLVIPVVLGATALSDFVHAPLISFLDAQPTGYEPGGLSRPPSISSIA